MEKIKEGHFKSQGKEFKTIWTFKKDEGFHQFFNTNEKNAEDALQLAEVCFDKIWVEWKCSNRYYEGYAYELNSLMDFYRGKPKRPIFKIGNKSYAV